MALTAWLWVLVALGCSGVASNLNGGGSNAVGGGAAVGGQPAAGSFAAGGSAAGGSAATGSTVSGGTTSTERGDATLNFSGCPFTNSAINGPGGIPDSDHYGAPLSNGGGYSVTCSVTFAGTYAVHAFIVSPDMILSVDSTNINAGASMAFYTVGGTPESIESVDGDKNPAASCTLTTSADGSSFVIEPGTIFAQYDCPWVRASANLTMNCHTSGFFYFTGCSS